MGEEQTYKIVVLGEGGVGKSAVTVQLTQNHFIVDYDPTIENSYRKQLMVDDVLATLDILDTAGQEEYAVMRHQYIRQGQGFALVYSVASRDTFESMGDFYEQIMDVKGGDKPAILLLANKVDLPPEERQVSNEDGQALAKKLNMTYFETSAKERINIDESFSELIRQIRTANSAAKENPAEKGGKSKKEKPKKEKKPKSEGDGRRCILL